MHASLLLLVDGRFPAGGHAYSAGVEAAVAIGDVADVDTLVRYLEGRLATTGLVDAAFAAHACARLGDGDSVAADLDVEYSARVLSPYLRATSRRLGRQLLRTATRVWSSPELVTVAATPDGPHQPVALGAVVAAAGGDASEAAAIAFHHLTAAVTSAAVRLLGLDPIDVAIVQERAGWRSDEYVQRAARWAAATPAELPACGGSLTEILGEHHGSLDARMFVA